MKSNYESNRCVELQTKKKLWKNERFVPKAKTKAVSKLPKMKRIKYMP